MKKKNIIPEKPVLALCALMFFALAGCEKDDMSNYINVAGNERAPKQLTLLRYQMINISHKGNAPADRNYSVAVMSDGRLTFTGTANTAVIGSVTTQLDDNTVSQLKEKFNGLNFNNLTPAVVRNGEPVINVAYKRDRNSDVELAGTLENRDTELSSFIQQIE